MLTSAGFLNIFNKVFLAGSDLPNSWPHTKRKRLQAPACGPRSQEDGIEQCCLFLGTNAVHHYIEQKSGKIPTLRCILWQDVPSIDNLWMDSL